MKFLSKRQKTMVYIIIVRAFSKNLAVLEFIIKGLKVSIRPVLLNISHLLCLHLSNMTRTHNLCCR